MPSRRKFITKTFVGGAGLWLTSRLRWMPSVYAQIRGGTLDPLDVLRYTTPMLIPPMMPKAGTVKRKGGKNADYYEISMRQFS